MTGHQIESNEHQSALKRKVESEAGPDHTSPVHPLLTLQSQIGNAQVARLLAQRAAEDEENVAAKHDLAQRAEDDESVAAKHDLAQPAEDDENVAAKHDLAQRAEDDENVAAKNDLAQR